MGFGSWEWWKWNEADDCSCGSFTISCFDFFPDGSSSLYIRFCEKCLGFWGSPLTAWSIAFSSLIRTSCLLHVLPDFLGVGTPSPLQGIITLMQWIFNRHREAIPIAVTEAILLQRCNSVQTELLWPGWYLCSPAKHSLDPFPLTFLIRTSLAELSSLLFLV